MQALAVGGFPAAQPLVQGHVLIVDDDPEVRSMLSTYLSRNGLRVGAFADGPSLRRCIMRRQVKPDLVVLDVMLPAEDGFSICRWLKSELDIPVLMLSARVDEVDRVLGFELGADDYVCKPFSPRELLARIQRLLRAAEKRHAPAPQPAVRRLAFHGWVLDVVDRTLVSRNGNLQRLSTTELLLLTVLAMNANRVMSRRALAQASQGRDPEPHERGIDVLVSRLRQLLGDSGRDPRIIRTVYGRGYMLCGDVERD
jgi:DNA-binding response OmpR family regulator